MKFAFIKFDEVVKRIYKLKNAYFYTKNCVLILFFNRNEVNSVRPYILFIFRRLCKTVVMQTGIPGLKIKSQKTISVEGSLPSFFLKSISFRKERSLSDRKGRLP